MAEGPITWTAFECDGRALEYAVIRSKQKTRPKGWPAHKPAPGPWVPDVMVVVRNIGEQNGPAMVFPAETEITTEHAVEAARLFWADLAR